MSIPYFEHFQDEPILEKFQSPQGSVWVWMAQEWQWRLCYYDRVAVGDYWLPYQALPVPEDGTSKLGICGRCYAEGVVVSKANCNEKPEELAGAPIGQYHCPDCGAMVLAGVQHPPLCATCLAREREGFDK